MKFGKVSLNALKGIEPNLIKVMTLAITNSPVDFTITNGVRTAGMQAALYAQGRTAPGSIVTMDDGIIRKSNHQVKADGYGHAVDLYPYINGAIDYDDKSDTMHIIAAHIKAVAASLNIHIVWGGDWTVEKEGLVDKPHFELK